MAIETQLGSLIINLTADDSGLIKAAVSVEQISKRVEQTNKRIEKSWINSLDRVSQKIRTVGYLTTATLTVPLTAFGKKAMTVAKDYEFAMAQIEGLAGVPKDMVQAWSASIKELATTTSIGPTKLADALYFVASSGFEGAEALKITEMSAKAMAAGMGDAAHIADMLTSSMNAYKTSGLTATRALDIFTAAIREGKIEPEQFASTIGSVLPVASELGVSLDQVAAAMAAMSLGGASASNAATYLRNVMQKIADPTAEVQKMLISMGTSAEALRNSLAGDGLMATLLKMRELADEFGESLFDLFPEVRGLIGVLNLTGENLQFNLKIFEEVLQSTGDFEKAFAVASDTMQYKWNRALAVSQTAMLTLGKTIAGVILPVVERFADKFAKFAKWLDGLSEGFKKLIVVIGVVVAALGPILLMLSTMSYLFTLAVRFVGHLRIALQALVVVFKAVRAASIATPLGAVAAVAALLIPLILKLRKSTSDLAKAQGEVVSEVNREVYSLQQVFAHIKNANEGTEERANWIKIANQRYGSYLGNLLTEKSSLEDITKAQNEALASLKALTAQRAVAAKIEEAMSNVTDAFEDKFGNFTKALVEAYGGDYAVQATAEIFSAIEKTAEKHGKTLIKSYSAYAPTEEILAGVKEASEIYDKFFKQLDSSKGALSPQTFIRVFKEVAKVKYLQDAHITTLQGLAKAYGTVEEAAESAANSFQSAYENLENPALKEIMKDMEKQERQYFNLLKASERFGFSTDANEKLLSLYADTLTALGKTGFPDAGAQIVLVKKKFDDLSASIMTGKGSVEDIQKILKKFNEESEFFVWMAQNAKELGIEFDYLREMSQLLNNTLKDLVITAGADSQAVKDIQQKIKDLPPDVTAAVNALKNLNEELAIINKTDDLKLPGFSRSREELQSVEKALNVLVEVRTTTEKLSKSSLALGAIFGAPFDQLIPVAEILDKQIEQLVNRYNELNEAILDEELQKALDIARQQVDAYGSLENQLDVLNKMVQFTERRLYRASVAAGDNTEEVIKLTKALEGLRSKQIELRHAYDTAYLEIMIAAYGKYSDKLNLVGAKITYVKAQIERLAGASIKDAAWGEELNEWLNQLALLEQAAQYMDALKDSLDSLATIFDKVGDALGGMAGEWTRWIGSLIKYIPTIIDLVEKYGKSVNLLSAVQEGQIAIEEVSAASKGKLAITSGILAGVQNAEAATSEAVTVAKGGEAIAGATAEGAKLPFPINIIAIALGVGAVIAALASSIPRPRKMKTGGTVPPGYPDDTFPALLTSGEIVVPPHEALAFAEKIMREKGKDVTQVTNVSQITPNNIPQPVEYHDMPTMLPMAFTNMPSGGLSEELQLLLSAFDDNTASSKISASSAPANLAKRSSPQGMNNMPLAKLSNLNTLGKDFTKFAKDFTKKNREVFSMMRTSDRHGQINRLDDRLRRAEKMLSQSKYTAVRMASGGIVPHGYPNDSFPALLSSGEMVLPKNISTSVSDISQKPQKIQIVVDGKIAGKDLALILRRQLEME